MYCDDSCFWRKNHWVVICSFLNTFLKGRAIQRCGWSTAHANWSHATLSIQTLVIIQVTAEKEVLVVLILG